MRDQFTRSVFHFIIAAIIILSMACNGEKTDEQKAVSLIDISQTAKFITETGYINLNSDWFRNHFDENWIRTSPEKNQERVITTRAKKAIFEYYAFQPQIRWLVFNFAIDGKLGNLAEQTISVSLGEQTLLSETITAPGWNELKVLIPRKIQSNGWNQLVFSFNEELPLNQDSDIPYTENYTTPLTGYFSEFQFYYGSDKTPGQRISTNDNNALRFVTQNNFLQQRVNSSLSNTFMLDGETSLSLEGVVKTNEIQNKQVDLEVEIRRKDDSQWSTVYKHECTPGSEYVIKERIDLGDFNYEIVQMRIKLTQEQGISPAHAIWKELLLSGIHMQQNAVNTGAGPDISRIENVFIILVDACRADMTSFNGNTEDLTPNIDQFSKKSITFTNVTAPSAFTIASVFSIFTGMNPVQSFANPVVRNEKRETVFVDDSIFSLAREFNEKGFHTVNLTANPYSNKHHGITIDFAEEISLRSRRSVQNDDCQMEQQLINDAIDQIASSGNKNFCYIHYLPPHEPYYPHDDFDFRYEIDKNNYRHPNNDASKLYVHDLISPNHPYVTELFQAYKDNVRYADQLVGETLDKLDNSGLLENSIVIILADHGEAFMEHGKLSHNHTVYDEMIRVPLVIYYPEVKPKTVAEHVGIIDVPASLADMFILNENNYHLAGRSFWPLIAGKRWSEKEWYFSIAFDYRPHFSWRNDKYKFFFDGSKCFLFDLESDPGELINIADQKPVLVDYLRQKGMLELLLGDTLVKNGKVVEMDEEAEGELRNLGYLN